MSKRRNKDFTRSTSRLNGRPAAEDIQHALENTIPQARPAHTDALEAQLLAEMHNQRDAKMTVTTITSTGTSRWARVRPRLPLTLVAALLVTAALGMLISLGMGRSPRGAGVAQMGTTAPTLPPTLVPSPTPIPSPTLVPAAMQEVCRYEIRPGDTLGAAFAACDLEATITRINETRRRNHLDEYLTVRPGMVIEVPITLTTPGQILNPYPGVTDLGPSASCRVITGNRATLLDVLSLCGLPMSEPAIAALATENNINPLAIPPGVELEIPYRGDVRPVVVSETLVRVWIAVEPLEAGAVIRRGQLAEAYLPQRLVVEPLVADDLVGRTVTEPVQRYVPLTRHNTR